MSEAGEARVTKAAIEALKPYLALVWVDEGEQTITVSDHQTTVTLWCPRGYPAVWPTWKAWLAAARPESRRGFRPAWTERPPWAPERPAGVPTMSDDHWHPHLALTPAQVALLGHVAIAAERDWTHPLLRLVVLRLVVLRQSETRLEMAAADGVRLHRACLVERPASVQPILGTWGDHFLPAALVPFMRRLGGTWRLGQAADGSDRLVATVDADQRVFCEMVVERPAPENGRFPDWEATIERPYTYEDIQETTAEAVRREATARLAAWQGAMRAANWRPSETRSAVGWPLAREHAVMFGGVAVHPNYVLDAVAVGNGVRPDHPVLVARSRPVAPETKPGPLRLTLPATGLVASIMPLRYERLVSETEWTVAPTPTPLDEVSSDG